MKRITKFFIIIYWNFNMQIGRSLCRANIYEDYKCLWEFNFLSIDIPSYVHAAVLMTTMQFYYLIILKFTIW